MTSSNSYLKDLLDVLDLIIKDLERRRKEKQELMYTMGRTAEWLSNCETEVCENPLCGGAGARCKRLSLSPPRCPSPKKPWVVVVDLDVTEEQEVVLQMEGEEMLTSGTVQLEDEESADGTSGAPSTVILSDRSHVRHECQLYPPLTICLWSLKNSIALYMGPVFL